MRAALVGIVIIGSAFSVSRIFLPETSVWAQPPRPSSAKEHSTANNGHGVIALSHTLQSGDLQVVVIDSQRRVMSVYEITAASGAITLKSVRNVQWDLMIEEYNGAKPYPREIRTLLERQ